MTSTTPRAITEDELADALRGLNKAAGLTSGITGNLSARDAATMIFGYVKGHREPASPDDAPPDLTAGPEGARERAGALAPEGGTLERLLTIIREVDAHIDARTAAEYRKQPLALHWARITKVCEEAGEVWAALSKCTGENPRKGVCGTWDDLLGELGDTVSAAACAIQHITKDEARTAEVIVAAFEKAHRRVAEVERRHA